MSLDTKHVSATSASKALLVLLFALIGEQARSEPLIISSFEFTYAAGRTERIREIGTALPSDETLAQIRSRHPTVEDVQLYCTAFSGPRFADIDGVVYKLNQQARREGAYVVTNQGRKELLDIDRPPSPLAGDFLMILKLVQDAGEGC